MPKIKDFLRNAQRWSFITVLYKRRLRVIKCLVSIAFITFFVILWKILGTWIFLIFWRFAFFFKFFVMKWRFWGFNTIWRLLSIFRFDVVGTMKWLWIWSYRNSLLLLNKLIIDLTNQITVVAFQPVQLAQVSFLQKNQTLQNGFLISVTLRWHRASVACKNQSF